MADSSGPPEVHFEFRIPERLEGGVYSNIVNVWHSPHEFTLDFASSGVAEGDAGKVTVPCPVTARVKLPVTVIFDLLRAINENMGVYEARFGALRRVGVEEPLYPPDDLTEGGDDNA